jgi:choloylglycine hydrolase
MHQRSGPLRGSILLSRLCRLCAGDGGESGTLPRAQEYGNWLLGNFSSVEEVKANFDKVVIVPVVVAQIKQAPPVHFVVHYRAGKSVVIEPIDGGLKIYDDPLRVMANSPTFDWHMTNLSNYINLSVLNVPPVQLSGLKLAQFGQGSGLHGFPGDYTSPLRFVRYSRSRETVIALAGIFKGSECRIANHV